MEDLKLAHSFIERITILASPEVAARIVAEFGGMSIDIPIFSPGEAEGIIATPLLPKAGHTEFNKHWELVTCVPGDRRVLDCPIARATWRPDKGCLWGPHPADNAIYK